MKIRSINQTNINRLQSAFYDYLLDNDVFFTEIGLIEEDDKLVLVFKLNEKLSVFKFD
ncbi:hypothetical protein [Neobacillus vireti]|uniref:hypothetical protein n=1 Tax=Neobacillus vireti TaxID=220686 RepID=UPI0004259365|nr:hypothetical protein [Neobacillus vireti]